MKPKTKNEIWALREQARLPELPQRTLDWAKRTLMRHDGYTWFAGAYSKKRRVVWCQNCGRVEYLPVEEEINESATRIAVRHYGIIPSDVIVGNAILCHTSMVE